MVRGDHSPCPVARGSISRFDSIKAFMDFQSGRYSTLGLGFGHQKKKLRKGGRALMVSVQGHTRSDNNLII